MLEAILIWLYLSLGNFVTWVGVISFILIGGYFAIFIPVACISDFGTTEKSYNESEKATYNILRSYLKTVLVTGGLVLLSTSMYPSKEELKWIIGGALVWNGVQAASDIEGVEQLPKNVVDAMNHFLVTIQEEDVDTSK